MKNYLLDTHVVLWFAEYSDKLSDNAYKAIQDPKSNIYVSIVSAWEIAIKLGSEKLNIKGGLPEFYRMTDSNGFITLPIEREYLLRLKHLPYKHKDPFDRMLIATAMTERMTLITADEKIHKYELPVLW